VSKEDSKKGGGESDMISGLLAHRTSITCTVTLSSEPSSTASSHRCLARCLKSDRWHSLRAMSRHVMSCDVMSCHVM
jgi:hypothetical protein